MDVGGKIEDVASIEEYDSWMQSRSAALQVFEAIALPYSPPPRPSRLTGSATRFQRPVILGAISSPHYPAYFPPAAQNTNRRCATFPVCMRLLYSAVMYARPPARSVKERNILGIYVVRGSHGQPMNPSDYTVSRK